MPQSSRYLKSVKAIANLKPREINNASQPLDIHVAGLRIWQSERLKKTHADLLRSKRFGPACNFFLRDIYSAQDFSQRDNDIEYLYEVMSSVLPNFLLKLVVNTIELNNLTKVLDTDLVRVLAYNFDKPYKVTPERYTEAYRICNNYDQRLHQIDLLMEIGGQVDFATRFPLIGTTLKLARGPAFRAGWGEVHAFLEAGFTAFKRMKGAKKFLAVVEMREKQILDAIFDGVSNPFIT